MFNKKNQSVPVSQEGQPQPQIIYMQAPKKRGGCLKFFGVAFIAFIAIVAIASMGMSETGDSTNGGGLGGSSEGTAVPKIGKGDNPAPVGVSAQGDGLEITLNGVVESESGGMMSPAEPGFVFLTLDVTIKNVSEEKKDFNTLYFSAKDLDNGYTFDDDLFGGDGTTNLGSGQLSAGDLVRGNVVIKVRADSTNIRIKYDTAPFGGTEIFFIHSR